MGSTGKLEVDVEVKSNPDNYWTAIRKSNELFPKVLPQQYKSVEILEGDGLAVGSVRLVTFVEGGPITLSKEKIEAVDEAKKTVAYSVIDGEVLTFYKTFKAQLEVAPKGDGSLVKWLCEFEKANEEVPSPDLFKDMAVKTFKELDDYLLKA